MQGARPRESKARAPFTGIIHSSNPKRPHATYHHFNLCPVPFRLAVVFAAEKEATKPYKETLSLLGITFRVKSSSMDGEQELIIIPKGLEIDNSTIKKPIKGKVTKAEVADLNADGSPEIYVYIILSGKDNRGEVVALSANKKKSLQRDSHSRTGRR